MVERKGGERRKGDSVLKNLSPRVHGISIYPSMVSILLVDSSRWLVGYSSIWSIHLFQPTKNPSDSLSLSDLCCLPVYGRSVSVAVQQKWERVFIGKVKPLLCFNQPLYLYQPLHSTPLLFSTQLEWLSLSLSTLFCMPRVRSSAPSFLPSPLFLLTNQLRSVSAVCRESYY